MRVLHLSLTKKWFDLILLQLTQPELAKYDEYRDFKHYFISRFISLEYIWKCQNINDLRRNIATVPASELWKQFDCIEFANGYQKDCRRMTIEFKGFSFGTGREAWGAEKEKDYFVLKLGKITDTKNC